MPSLIPSLGASRLALILLALIVVLVEPGQCKPQAQLKQTRLPASVEPLEYDIELDFANEFATLEGKVDILVEINSDTRESCWLTEKLAGIFQKRLDNQAKDKSSSGINEILMNLDGRLEVLQATMMIADSAEALAKGAGIAIKKVKVSQDAERQLVVLRFDERLRPGLFGRLSIDYRNASPNLSAIVSAGMHDGDGRVESAPAYHTAHLQAGHARQLVPCFEEPHLRSKIRLTVNQPHFESGVISNMPSESRRIHKNGIAYKSTQFQQSPPMSISALALAIGPYDEPLESSSEPDSDSPKVLLIATPGHQERGQFAVEFAQRCFKWLQDSNKFTRYPLKEFKLIAVPATTKHNITTGFGVGLINHKFLLVDSDQITDEETNSHERKIEPALNVALVVARQWFGNTLAPKSWSDLWITEGLAAHVALQMVGALEPDLLASQYVRANFLQRALALDSNGNYPPISHPGDYPYNDPHLSTSPFELVRLIKGAAIMQMLQRDIAHQSANSFRNRLAQLMVNKMAINLLDLAEAFASDEIGRDEIVQLLRPWKELSGYPNLELSLATENRKSISIRQATSKRLNGLNELVDDRSFWPVPLEIIAYNKLDLMQFGKVAMFDSIRGKRFRQSQPLVRLDLPAWMHIVAGQQSPLVDMEVADDYESLPYYKVSCPPKISCRGTVANAAPEGYL